MNCRRGTPSALLLVLALASMSFGQDLYVETTVYGGAAAPYVMAGYARGGLWPGYPYAPGPLATGYSYGVYGYPYYSFYRPSLAYSWWGPPGMVGPSYFGYGGYGLPYGYYGYGGAFYW